MNATILPFPVEHAVKTFEVGKLYHMRSLGDYDCVWTYRIASRTASTVTLEPMEAHQKGGVKRVKISMGEEVCSPLGVYSMSPLLRASKVGAS